MNAVFRSLTPEQIRKLRKIEKQLVDVCVKYRPYADLLDAQKAINDNLPCKKKSNMPYVKSVTVAFDYASSHYRTNPATGSDVSIIDDIIAGKTKIAISNYPVQKP